MADEHTRDELAQLRTLVEAQQAEFAAYRARHEHPRRHAPRLPRRFLPLLLAALLVALVPLATLAASPFNDLTGGVHDANIGLIYDAGITKGCVPNVSYCPTANVTREEMASFLARTAGLGANPPVVNAKTAQTAGSATTAGHASSADTATTATNATNATNAQNAVTAQTATNATSAQSATTAQTAENANALGGQPPSAYLPSTGDLTMRYPFYNLVLHTTAAGSTTVTNFKDGVALQATTTGQKTYLLPLDRPTQAFGRNLAVKSIEVCFYTDGAATSITSTSAAALREEGIPINAISETAAHTGGTPTTASCYTVNTTAPTAYGQALYLQLVINFTDTTTRIILRSAALTLTPTTVGAAETGEPATTGPESATR